MNPQEQMADIKARCNEERLISNIRPVTGGYVVNASCNWRDPDTGGYVMSRNDECVATSPEDATTKALCYLNTGGFSPPVQASLPTI